LCIASGFVIIKKIKEKQKKSRIYKMENFALIALSLLSIGVIGMFLYLAKDSDSSHRAAH
jgi:ActR/RegA family two-component response regulator